MAASESTTQSVGTDTENQPFTVHREPADQGGNQYLKCKCCKREVIGDDFSRLNHREGCRHHNAQTTRGGA